MFLITRLLLKLKRIKITIFFFISQANFEKKIVDECAKWWEALLVDEEEVDVDKMWRERSMDTLHQDDRDVIAKEQYDQYAKKIGKPTSKAIQHEKMMRDAWNAPGSPFAGQEFDLSHINFS